MSSYSKWLHAEDVFLLEMASCSGVYKAHAPTAFMLYLQQVASKCLRAPNGFRLKMSSYYKWLHAQASSRFIFFMSHAPNFFMLHIPSGWWLHIVKSLWFNGSMTSNALMLRVPSWFMPPCSTGSHASYGFVPWMTSCAPSLFPMHHALMLQVPSWFMPPCSTGYHASYGFVPWMTSCASSLFFMHHA